MPALLCSLRRFPFSHSAAEFRHSNGPCYAEELKDPDLNPGQIKFIPRKSVPRRGRMRVVIIVPALA